MYKILSSLVISILVATSIGGCKKILISESNINQHNHIIVEADNGYQLSMPEFYGILYDNDYLPNGGILETDILKETLDSMLIDTLLGMIANEMNISDYVDMNRKYKILRAEALISRYFEEKAYKDLVIDSIEATNHYYSSPDIYGVPEQVLAYHIIVSKKGFLYSPDSNYYKTLTDEEISRKLEEKISYIYSLLGKERSFKSVATEHSHSRDASTKGGFLNWTKRNFYEHPFDSVAFSLKPEEFSKPYEDNNGWNIIYVEDHISGGIPLMTPEILTFAAENLFIIEANEARKLITDSLSNLDRKILINEYILDKNVFHLPGSTWVAIFNDRDTMDVYAIRNPEKVFRERYRVASTTPQMKREMIATAANWYITIQAAIDEKIDTLPELVEMVNTLKHSYMKNAARANLSSKSFNPPRNDIEEYYNNHIDEFVIAKPLIVQHILCQDSLLAEFVRDQANTGVDFLSLAKEYYDSDFKKRVGLADLGKIGPEDVEESFYKEALITRQGKISKVVKTNAGYHVIKVIKRVYDRSVDNASAEIRAVLKEQLNESRYNNYKQFLFAKYNLKFRKKLQRIHLPPSDYRGE